MTETFTDGLKIHKPPAEKVQDTLGEPTAQDQRYL